MVEKWIWKALPTSQLILQPFRCFAYVAVHSPTLLSLLLRHKQSSISNLSVTSPTLQLILQPFRHFTYVTTHSPTLPLLHLRHSTFSNPSFASSTSQALHLIHLESGPWLTILICKKWNIILSDVFFVSGWNASWDRWTAGNRNSSVKQEEVTRKNSVCWVWNTTRISVWGDQGFCWAGRPCHESPPTSRLVSRTSTQHTRTWNWGGASRNSPASPARGPTRCGEPKHYFHSCQNSR